jgi:TRAP-type mannitol/chloroaromatic compound transport system permease small subunit
MTDPESSQSAETVYLRLARRLDLVSSFSGELVAWFIIPMVLGLTYEVVARYLFNSPTVWAYDMTFMMYGSYFMLGTAFTLQRKGHVRTDSFYGAWAPRRQALVDAACYVLMYLPFVLVLLVVGWGYFYKSFTTGERFVTSPWMPIVWPFKLVLPFTGLLLLVQGLSECFKCLHTLATGAWPVPAQSEPEPEQVIV